MTAPPVLRTARLTLRPIAPDDAEALFPLFADAEAMRYWSRPPFAVVDEVRDWIAIDERWPAWVVIADGAIVGRIVLGARRQRVAEIGYLIGRPWWRRGFAREALAAVIGHGFAACGLRRIFADVDPDNVASLQLLERLGFAREGVLRAEWETHLGVRDSVILGLLCDEWPHRG